MDTIRLQRVAFKLLQAAGLPADHAQGGEVNRTSRGSLVDARSFDDVWDYRGTVTPLQSEASGAGGPGTDPVDQRRWERYLLGHGETWLFKNSDADLRERGSRARQITAGTFTTSDAGGLYGGRIIIASGNSATFPSSALPATLGWTLRVLRNENAGGWDQYAIYGLADVSAGNAFVSKNGATPVTGASLGVDNWLDVNAAGDFGLMAEAESGAGATPVDYAEVEIRPFQINAEIAQLVTVASEESGALPTYLMDGDAIDVSKLVRTYVGRSPRLRINKGIARQWEVSIREISRNA